MTKHLGRVIPSSVFSKLFSGFLTGPVPVLETGVINLLELTLLLSKGCYRLAVRGRRRC